MVEILVRLSNQLRLIPDLLHQRPQVIFLLITSLLIRRLVLICVPLFLKILLRHDEMRRGIEYRVLTRMSLFLIMMLIVSRIVDVDILEQQNLLQPILENQFQ